MVSFMAPYVCERCNLEEEKLLEVTQHFPRGQKPRRVPGFACKRCGQPMMFDDLPERYLGFLDDQEG